MGIKEILIATVIALITGVVIVHYEYYQFGASEENGTQPQPPQSTISNVSNVSDAAQPPSPIQPVVPAPSAPPDRRKQLQQLHHPNNATITVTFWLNLPGKTQLTVDEEVTLYYKFDDNAESNGYFTLFNVSPEGSLSLLFQNLDIQANRIYSLPKAQIDWQPEQLVAMDSRLSLEKGEEYFKAIVTSAPLSLETELATALQEMAFWGTSELTVFVQ
ncbi:MAG: hypothetical protein DRR19_30305 [Candidatus Parabeggiatoa sp. nov. 1]|nr:MAG: hypothetical protein DRR19_30305 [Gammaproteobacteria bacterium]